MNNFDCPICYMTFENPIECLKCHNNFCKQHLKEFNKDRCLVCNYSPFQYTENTWLRRTILNMSTKCSLCEFEGDEESFWSHLIEKHKKEIISHFKEKDQFSSINSQSKQNPQQPKFNPSIQNSRQYEEEQPPQQREESQQSYGYNNYQPYNNYSNGINNISIVPPPTHRANPPRNNINQSGPSIINVPSTERVKYCGKINQIIKCNCCPDHLCKKGNCMCVFCMKENFNKLKLNKNNQLLNKVGKIAVLYKGSFYCNSEYEAIIRNVVGKTFKRKSICKFPGKPCDNCKYLDKFQKIYLQYL